MTTDRLTDQQLADLQTLAARVTGDPFFVSDCESKLQVWRECALVRVTRDETGAIDGYSFPTSYRSTDQVIEIDLDSWDPGEDATDDQRRQDINDLVDARAAVPALLAEVRRLRATAEEFRALFGNRVVKGRDGDWANIADWIATGARIPACGAFYPPATDTRCYLAKGHRRSHLAEWGTRDMAWPYDPRETQPPLSGEELADDRPAADCRECGSVTRHDGLCAICRQEAHEAWWPTRPSA